MFNDISLELFATLKRMGVFDTVKENLAGKQEELAKSLRELNPKLDHFVITYAKLQAEYEQLAQLSEELTQLETQHEGI